jgi:putative transposase
MDDEIIIRKQAVELHLKDFSIVEIAQQLGKSRQWVHKWIKRYRSLPGDDWYRSISRTPRQIKSKTPKDLEDMVVNIRKSFEGNKYSQTGALSIMYEFERLGVKSPSIATINRILTRNKLVNKSSVKQLKKKNIQTFLHLFNKWTWLGPSIFQEDFAFTF